VAITPSNQRFPRRDRSALDDRPKAVGLQDSNIYRNLLSKKRSLLNELRRENCPSRIKEK